MKKAFFDTPEGQLIAIWDRYKDGYEMALHHTRAPDLVGRIAERILLEQARVPFDDGGEDSAGRAKGRRMKAAELVAGAFDIAEAYVKEIEERGHMYNMPTHDEIENALKDAENKN